MADIVRLEENGVPIFMITHVEAVEDIDKILKKPISVYKGATFLNASTTIDWDPKLLTETLYITVCLYDVETSKPLDRLFTTFAIPVTVIESFAGLSHKLMMSDSKAYKFVYCSKNKIVGHADNSGPDNRVWCIREVSVI